MSDIGALVERLIEHGLSISEASSIIAEAVAAGAAAAAYRRSPGALRTEKWRVTKRHKTSQCDAREQVSPSVTERHKASQSVTCDNAPLTIDKDIKKRERQARGSRIAPDWKLSAGERSFARDLGWSEPQIDREAENFLDYWVSCAGAKGLKLDWTATWRKWIRDSRTKPAGPTIIAQPSDTDWRAILDSHRRFKHWPKGHGNEPGMPGCRAPPELLREFGFETGGLQ